MHAHHSTGWIALICLLALGVGCSETGTKGWFANPFAKKPPKDESGILAPPEQVKMLKEMAKDASSRSPEDQQRLSEMLVQLLKKESDPLLRAEALRTLQAFPTETARAAIRGALKDSDSDVRVRACDLLAKNLDAAAVTALSETLTGAVDHDVRLAGARALGEAKDPAAVRALGVALEDPDPAMQYRAVTSLQKVTGKDLGSDVERWRQYVKGEPPPTSPPTSVADRLKQLF